MSLRWLRLRPRAICFEKQQKPKGKIPCYSLGLWIFPRSCATTVSTLDTVAAKSLSPWLFLLHLSQLEPRMWPSSSVLAEPGNTLGLLVSRILTVARIALSKDSGLHRTCHTSSFGPTFAWTASGVGVPSRSLIPHTLNLNRVYTRCLSPPHPQHNIVVSQKGVPVYIPKI